MNAVDMKRQKQYVKDSLSLALKELKMAQEGKIQLENARDPFIGKSCSIWERKSGSSDDKKELSTAALPTPQYKKRKF